MEKKTKIIIGVVAGVTIIGGIAYFLYQRKKKRSGEIPPVDGVYEGSASTQPSGTKSVTSEEEESFPMGYLSNKGDNPNGHAVHLAVRPPQGTINKGDTVKISGTSFDGAYKVNHVWLDANNNVGAIFINIRYTPTGASDRTFENVGTITLI